MSIKLIIQLSGDWVLEHREDDVLPVQFLKNFVRKNYDADLRVEDSGLTELSLVSRNESVNGETVCAEIRGAFLKHYSLEEGSDVIQVQLEVLPTKAEAPSMAEVMDKVAETLFPSESAPAGESAPAETATSAGATTPEKKDDAQQEPVKAAESVDKVKEEMEKINDFLVGGEEFKALAREICQIAPQIIENKTFDTFCYQSYIFAINEGCGLSTYLSTLANLLCALKLKPSTEQPRIIEEKLDAPKGDSYEPFEDADRALHRVKKGVLTLLCVDISEWLDNTNTRIFKRFLMEAERYKSEVILVFRVPFVDKEVLDKLQYSLNDLMFVRTISFPPFTKQEIQKCAARELEGYGFRMSASAWDAFHQRIAEEKSDGKFYGLNTIKKVVRELLYKKQLSNAKRSKPDKAISKRDAAVICAETQHLALSGYEMLDALVAGQSVKERLNEIISQIELARANSDWQAPCIHMRFVGNPGTGKTTVARIVGKILKERGVLRVGNFYEYAGRDFCGRYIGETAPKTASMCRDAYGSVLFIDEAYSLYRGDGNERDYGREALDTLIAEMENHRSDLVVIMAGYTDDMEKLMEGNAGLASRMPYVIEFPNFTREQLYEIFVSMVSKQFKYDEALLPRAKAYFDALPDAVLNAKEFSNARFVRNLFERTWAKAAMRCQLAGITTVTLTKDDFERSVSDKEFNLIMQKKKQKIGFAD